MFHYISDRITNYVVSYKYQLSFFVCTSKMFSYWRREISNLTQSLLSVYLLSFVFIKLSLIEGCIKVNDIDIICLWEMFLDSSIPIDDNRLSIPVETIMRAEHPSKTKRGGVWCLYYKEHLPIIQRDDISDLKECLVTEITVKNERCFLTHLFRSPGENHEQLQSFCDSLSWHS